MLIHMQIPISQFTPTATMSNICQCFPSDGSQRRIDFLTFAPGNFYDGAAVIFLELLHTDSNRFNTTVGAGSNAPKKIDILTKAVLVELRRHFQEVNVA